MDKIFLDKILSITKSIASNRVDFPELLLPTNTAFSLTKIDAFLIPRKFKISILHMFTTAPLYKELGILTMHFSF